MCSLAAGLLVLFVLPKHCVLSQPTLDVSEASAEQRRRCKKRRLRVSSPDSRAMVTRMLAAAGRPHAATARAAGAMARCCWLSHTSYTA